jgi:hypothetical protein
MLNSATTTIDEKLVTGFLEAAYKRPQHIVLHLGMEIVRICGPRRLEVRFVTPSPTRDASGNELSAEEYAADLERRMTRSGDE